MKEKFLSLILATLPLVAVAQGVEIGGVYYNLDADNKFAEVTMGPFSYDPNGFYWEGTYSTTIGYYSGEIVIPSEVEYEKIKYCVNSIGEMAFSGCYNLSSVVLPSTIVSIGQQAFSNCWTLTNIDIPTSTTDISSYAFEHSGLTSLYIPESVRRIGSLITENCFNLEGISVSENNQYYDSRNNCNAIIISSSNKLILGCKNTVIPNGTTEIGESALFGCRGLQEIAVPASITTIGAGAFSYCLDLSNVSLPDGLKEISGDAFRGCKSLHSIQIPGSVEKIGIGAFCCCNLTSLSVSPDNPYYDSRNDCQGIIETATNSLIQGCNTTVIPEGVTSIGEIAFTECTLIERIDIPQGVKEIGDGAFSNSSLKSVTLPESLASIGNNAFYNCESLTQVKAKMQEPIAIPENVFWTGAIMWDGEKEHGTFTNASLLVPTGKVELYQSSDVWNKFSLIETFSEETDNIENINSLTANPFTYYNLRGNQINVPQKGVYILKFNNGKTKKVVVR